MPRSGDVQNQNFMAPDGVKDEIVEIGNESDLVSMTPGLHQLGPGPALGKQGEAQDPFSETVQDLFRGTGRFLENILVNMVQLVDGIRLDPDGVFFSHGICRPVP